MKSGIKRFFAYARARHQITLDRAAGKPRPWTRDPILSKYRFTCVFRELDKTTQWFRRCVRDPLRETAEVLPATVIFRLLNRIEVGEAVFNQGDIEYESAFAHYVATRDVRVLRRAIRANCGGGPYVTGAYIITSPPGYSKLDGMMEIIRMFNRESREWRGLGAGVLGTMNWGGEEGAAQYMLANRGDVTLESAWNWLRQFKFFGPFHSYEMVTDLRHTKLLDRAPDIMTWANPGPGANRGANRVQGRDKDARNSRDRLIEEMRELLHVAHTDSNMWPETNKLWPCWEMRDVEHTLCEFDKYERVRLEEGRPRGVYR